MQRSRFPTLVFFAIFAAGAIPAATLFSSRPIESVGTAVAAFVGAVVVASSIRNMRIRPSW